MSDKKSEQNTILLRIDPLSYFLIDIATPYWKKYANADDKSRQGLIRKASTAFAIQILKEEGVYEKAVENYKLEQAGANILKEKEDNKVTTLSEMELP
jgi:hypothetical protein